MRPTRWLCTAFLSLAGCITANEKGQGTYVCPTTTDFRTVSGVLERRCGSLSCHGTQERPFRLYGQYGLRRPEIPVNGLIAVDGGTVVFEDYVSGGLVATTDAELNDNYVSACGLEPEIMDKVVQNKPEPEELTLVRKPRLTEAHKGGKIWGAGSATGTQGGDACLLSWLEGKVDDKSCEYELEKP